MIFSFDLDGTLVNFNKQINPSTIEAIQEARSKGHTTVISTGRPLEGIIPIHEVCPVDYWICSNGATIVNAKTKEVLNDSCIDKQTAIEAIEFFRDKVESFLIQGKHKIQFNYGEITCDHGYDYYEKVHWPKGSNIDQLPGEILVDIKQFAAFGIKMPVSNIISRTKNNPKLKNLNPIPVKLHTGDYWFDIPLSSSDKGSALHILAKKINKTDEELYHFGDSYNDLTAMQDFIGVATIHSPEHLQEIAIEIIDEEHGGIGKFIREHI